MRAIAGLKWGQAKNVVGTPYFTGVPLEDELSSQLLPSGMADGLDGPAAGVLICPRPVAVAVRTVFKRHSNAVRTDVEVVPSGRAAFMGLMWGAYSVSVGLASHVLSEGVGVLAEEVLAAPSCSSARNPPSGDSSVSLAQADSRAARAVGNLLSLVMPGYFAD